MKIKTIALHKKIISGYMPETRSFGTRRPISTPWGIADVYVENEVVTGLLKRFTSDAGEFGKDAIQNIRQKRLLLPIRKYVTLIEFLIALIQRDKLRQASLRLELGADDPILKNIIQPSLPLVYKEKEKNIAYITSVYLGLATAYYHASSSRQATREQRDYYYKMSQWLLNNSPKGITVPWQREINSLKELTKFQPILAAPPPKIAETPNQSLPLVRTVGSGSQVSPSPVRDERAIAREVVRKFDERQALKRQEAEKKESKKIAELEEQKKKEAELAELAAQKKKEAELAVQKKKEAELAELAAQKRIADQEYERYFETQDVGQKRAIMFFASEAEKARILSREKIEAERSSGSNTGFTSSTYYPTQYMNRLRHTDPVGASNFEYRAADASYYEDQAAHVINSGGGDKFWQKRHDEAQLERWEAESAAKESSKKSWWE